jgi:P4 family phage/plasmid primase-like protien
MAGWESANGRLGQGANWYASNGWRVLPVHGIGPNGMCTCGRNHKESKEIGKHPASLNGQKDATTDTVVVQSWWEENPDYNIGIYAKDSGFFVIDIDPRHNGHESILKLEERAGGNLPQTVEAITGEYSTKNGPLRGRHLIYRCNPNEKFIGNFKSQGLDGIDIKHNGYILVAPSRHSTGYCYEWKPGHAPWQMEIAEAPEELLAVIRAKSLKTSSSISGTNYIVSDWEFLRDLQFGDTGNKLDIDKILEEGIDEGGRAVGLYQLACALANKFGTDIAGRTSVEAMMMKFNAEMVRPPLDIEGSNGLLMHTRRAIEFVASNPIWEKWWEGLKDYKPENGMEWAKKASENFVKAPTASSSFNYYLADVVESSDLEILDTANAVGDQVATLAAKGRSLRDITAGGNLDLPKDVDSISPEAGGRQGARSLTDVGNGRRLIDAFGSTIRYTPNVGWFVWNGNYWRPDAEMSDVKEIAKHVSTVIAREAASLKSLDDPRGAELVKWANSAKSNGRINAMLEQATSDPRVGMSVEDWDKNPYLLGVKNGVVDLKTGVLHEGDIESHITRVSPISYTQGLTNLRWKTFLNEAFNGDQEYIDWVQKAVGYTATGLNNQDVVFIIYGPPGSGKNTFIETIFEALGKAQHAWALDSNVLALGDRISSTDEYHMAELRGRRMIWVDELPENERIKENQIKKLTGSGTIQGRSPGEKPIQFTSTGKLWISTNHRPIITDEAMWRRLLPIPLTNKPAKPDPGLKKYLADPDGALPAVLAWIVEGAVKYLASSQDNPLEMCTVVREAHEIYKKNEDRIGAFIEEETQAGSDGVLVNKIYQRYKEWSDSRGERPITQIAFHRKLSDRGLDIIGTGNKAILRGLILLPHEIAMVQQADFASAARFSSYTGNGF